MHYALCMHEGSKSSKVPKVPYRCLRYGFASPCHSYLVCSSNIYGVLEKELGCKSQAPLSPTRSECRRLCDHVRGTINKKQEARSQKPEATAGSRLGHASLSASDVNVTVRGAQLLSAFREFILCFVGYTRRSAIERSPFAFAKLVLWEGRAAV